MKNLKTTILCFTMLGALVLSGCGKEADVNGEPDTTPAPAADSTPEPISYYAVPELDPESAAGFVSEKELLDYFARVDKDGETDRAPLESAPLIVSAEGQGSKVVTLGGMQYVLSGREMIILRLNWSDSEVQSTTTVGMDWTSETTEDSTAWKGSEKVPFGLYAYNHHVAVISDRFAYSGVSGNADDSSVAYKEYTSVDIYDVSDPTAPVLESSLGQSGYFQDASVYNGTLTVVTCFDVTDEALYPAGYNYDEAIQLPLEKIAGVTQPFAASIEVIGAYELDGDGWDLFGVAGTDTCGCLSEGTLVFSSCRTAEAPSRTYTENGIGYTETAFVGVTDVLVISSQDGVVSYSAECTLPAKALAGATFSRTDTGWAVLAQTDAHRETESADGKRSTEDEFTGWNVLLLDDGMAFTSAVPVYEDTAPVWCALCDKCAVYGNENGKITYTSYDGAASLSWQEDGIHDGYFVLTAEDVYLLGQADDASYLFRFGKDGEMLDSLKLGEDYHSLFENRGGWFGDEKSERLGMAADDSYCVYLVSDDKLILEKDFFTNDWGWYNQLISVDGVYYLTDSKEMYVLASDDLSELAHIEF